jgi:hypothetical protein
MTRDATGCTKTNKASQTVPGIPNCKFSEDRNFNTDQTLEQAAFQIRLTPYVISVLMVQSVATARSSYPSRPEQYCKLQSGFVDKHNLVYQHHSVCLHSAQSSDCYSK